MRQAGDVDGLAWQSEVDFGFLPFFFFSQIVDGEDHCDVDHLIEMAPHPFQFALYVFTDGRGHFEMMSADCEIHTHSFDDVASCSCAPVKPLRIGTLKKQSQAFAESDGWDLECLTVFGHRAARNDHPLFPQHVCDLAV